MDVDKHIEKAEEAVRRRNYDFAISLYLQLLQISPNNQKARSGLYEASLRQHDRKRGGKGKKGGGIGSSLGILMRTGGRKDPAAVIVACDKMLARNPRDVTALERLGYAASKAGHLESAVFAFAKLLELKSDDLQAAKNLGRLQQRLGKIQDALESYDRALQINPGDQESIKARKDLAAEAAIRGHGYAEAKSTMDLLKDKDQARELELTERVVHDEQGINEALARVRERIEEEPDNRKLLNRLGELLEQKGELAEAREVFTGLSALEPSNFDHRERVGDLKIREQEALAERLQRDEPGSDAAAAASNDLEKLKVAEFGWRVEEHPTDLPQRFRFGEALYQVGRWDDAIAEFQKTLKDPRKRLDSQVMMANAFMKKGMLDLAAKQLERALESAGDGTRRAMQIRYNLGLILEKQGKREEARAEYMLVYERDINFRDVKTRLESLEKKSAEE